jgi:uroporphyrinogen decarboxylase
MDSRERILTVLQHREPDRVPVHDSPWAATVARWRHEGLPEDVSPADHFGFEMQFIGCDLTPRFPVETLEETEEFIVQRTSTGGIRRNFRDISTTPEVIECPIKTKDDWPAIRDRLHADESRGDWEALRRQVDDARAHGRFICLTGFHGYDILQAYVPSEQLLMTMATDPDWVREMIWTLATLSVEMAKIAMQKGIEFDAFWNYNDMGYRNGLLFSPRTYRITHKDADRMAYGFFHEHDKPVFLHSCGNVSELIPDLIEVGLDCLQPLEVKAGMDVRRLKAEFGDELAFMGGIDVRAMAADDPALIEEEIASKFEVAKAGGGYIYHSDHSVPKNVSFERYEHVMELVRKYGQY